MFDAGLWTDEVLAARAAHYGMTVEQYKTKSVLRTEIRSHDVAELTAETCGPCSPRPRLPKCRRMEVMIGLFDSATADSSTS